MKRQRSVILFMVVFLLSACGSGGQKETKIKSLNEMAVNVNGSKLRLYGKAKDFMGDDWEISFTKDYKKKIGSNEEIFAGIAMKNDSHQEVSVKLKNWKDQSVKAEDAQITSITLDNLAQGKMKISLPKNLNEKSTPEAFIKAFGMPALYSANTSDKGDIYFLGYGSKFRGIENEGIGFIFKKNKLDCIKMQASKNTKKADKNTTFNIEDIIGYKPFTTIKNRSTNYSDILSKSEFIIDNVTIYDGQIIGALLNDGWVMKEIEHSGWFDDVTLVKAEKLIHVTTNENIKTSSDVTAETKIDGIQINFDNLGDTPITLLNGLTRNSSADQVMDKLGMAHEVYYSEYGLEIRYQKMKRDMIDKSVDFNFDVKGKMVDFGVSY